MKLGKVQKLNLDEKSLDEIKESHKMPEFESSYEIPSIPVSKQKRRMVSAVNGHSKK
jgi:hypothetical protein